MGSNEMGTERLLIVNADDFGLSDRVNEGVQAAHERGIVSSASLMVRAAAARGAAAYAARRPRLALGLHVDLGEWVWDEGVWRAVYEVVRPDDAAAVRSEVDRQVGLFRALTGKDPTHLDSHQHVHLQEPVRTALSDVASELDVPLRGVSPTIAHQGEFYGQTATGEPLAEGITVDRLVELLRGLGPGTTELSCHPGLDPELASVYRDERFQEVRALTDPRVLATVVEEGIRLIPHGNRMGTDLSSAERFADSVALGTGG